MGKAGKADESFGNTTGQKAESLGKVISPLVRNEITIGFGEFQRSQRRHKKITHLYIQVYSATGLRIVYTINF